MESNKKTHPSYGQAVFSRVSSGGTKLYASPIPRHHEFITLRISQSEVRHDLGQDWRMGGNLLIEVAFSAAQFAQLLTTMNVGEGSPCTISFIRRHGEIPPVPDDDITESERVKDYFKSEVHDFVNRVSTTYKLVSDIFEANKGKVIKKDDRAKIKDLLRKVIQDVECNWTFVVEQFQKASAKVEVSVKAEIEAIINSAIAKLGIDSLKNLLPDNQTKALEAHSK